MTQLKLNGTKGRGKIVLVDDEDYELVKDYNWFYAENGIVRNARIRPGVWRHVYLHREIMQPPPGAFVDHKSGDICDNRRSNLRLANYSENAMNSRRRVDNRSGYKGVSWHRAAKKWQVSVVKDGKHLGLGLFNDPVDAAKAYDQFAIENYGKFARTNF